MIIVEGSDGSGKTTLIDTLVEHFGFPVAARVVSKEAKAMVDLVKWVDDNLTLGIQPIIYDRHRLISESIYGPVLRRQMEPGFDNLNWLRRVQKHLRSLDPMVIFCVPPWKMVEDNLRDDPDNKVVVDKASEIYWLYFNLAASWDRAIIWDYTQPFAQHMMFSEIKTWIYKHHLRPYGYYENGDPE